MEYIFYLSTPLLLISGIPQTIKLLKRKHSKDISIITYFCTWFAVLLLTIKSYSIGDLVLALANSMSVCTLTTNLFLIIKYRNNES